MPQPIKNKAARQTTSASTIERSTRLGRIRGIDRLGVETYRGVRYAEPAQRFRAAVLATRPWRDVYDATTCKAVAVQPPISADVYGPVPEAAYAEDCLLLNIHAPKAPAPEARPVIVFIHGGSFTTGSAHCYDGTALAFGADAVVVCINYRLGLFAAFDLDWLGTERDGQGQLWLGDQITALRWVRDNIADYGGDPGRVTVIGESAGAVSVAALCAAPQAEGLVHRAVACSAGYLVLEPSRDVVAAVAKTRGKTRAQTIEYLKTATTAELTALQKRSKMLSPLPVAGTPLLPGSMEELIEARGGKAVPLIAGYATHEGLSMELMLKVASGYPQPIVTIVAHIVARHIAMHGAKGKANVKRYLRLLRKVSGGIGFGSAFSNLIWTDGFRRGAVDYAEMTTRAGSRAWVYAMDIPMRFAGRTIASSHGIDVALTFNPGDDPEATVPMFADHPNATPLARRWVAMLGHFARYGEPGDALGEWPAHEPLRRASLWVSGDRCSVKHDLEARYRREVWERLPAPAKAS
ncbi:carboxylesterase family protein [Hydrocarboniphaga effusa]|uniref:carboxylesterase family protein n=1 Tax=Hydrocarboniphaga effusa TaxID=243629 RepID=UPI003137D341